MFHCHSFPGSKRVKFLLPPGKDRWRNATPISLGLSWSLTKPHFGIGAAPSTFTMVYRGICQVILPKKNMDEGMTQRKVFAWVAIHLAIRKKKIHSHHSHRTRHACHSHLAQGLEGEICPFCTGIAYSAPYLGQTSMGWKFTPGKHVDFWPQSIPIGSMYGIYIYIIFTYIWLKLMVFNHTISYRWIPRRFFKNQSFILRADLMLFTVSPDDDAASWTERSPCWGHTIPFWSM